MIPKVGQHIIEYVAQVFDLHVNVGTQCDTGVSDLNLTIYGMTMCVCVCIEGGGGCV